MTEEDAVEALAVVAAVGGEGPAGALGVPAHASAGASAFFRPRTRIATPRTKRPMAMPCEVERVVPGTVPRGSPRKISTVKRRIAAPMR